MKSPLVFLYGAGVNTLAALISYKRHGIKPDVIIFSDTRGEKPETYEHIDQVVKPWLAAMEWYFIIVCRADFGRGKTGDQSLEAECLRLGTMPSRAYGFGTCAQKWKIDPARWWLESWPPVVATWASGGRVRRAIGYDAGERRRMLDDGDPLFTNEYPLIDAGWYREDCVREIQAEGMTAPPKSACFYCPSSTKTEIIQLGKRHPPLLGRALSMEARALDTGRCGIKGLGRRFAWRDIAAADEAQLALFSDAPVEACAVCHDGGGEDE